jgi:hypothetical protein
MATITAANAHSAVATPSSSLFTAVCNSVTSAKADVTKTKNVQRMNRTVDQLKRDFNSDILCLTLSINNSYPFGLTPFAQERKKI